MIVRVLKQPDHCKFYVSIEQPECGEVATKSVKVNTPSVVATVPLCEKHVGVANQRGARSRVKNTVRKPGVVT